MTGGNHDGPVVQVAFGDARLASCLVDGDEQAVVEKWMGQRNMENKGSYGRT